MRRLSGYLRACHPGPTVAVTFVITAFAWALGWRAASLGLILAAVLLGQLSVGWSNDAYDAPLDARAGRSAKPTVRGDVTARALWVAAGAAFVASSALSWAVAGAVGGSCHVFAVVMAWLYNTLLSRTAWSWVPYALAFAAVPPFLTYGLDGSPPAAWTVAVFAIVGVSAHIANALPDLADDRAAGLDGFVVRLGRARAQRLCWALLGVGTAILALVAAGSVPAYGVVVIVAFVVAAVAGVRSHHRSAEFVALLAVVVVDVAALVIMSARLL